MRRASSELYTGGFGRFFTLVTSGHLMRSHQQQLRAHTPNSLGVVARW